MKDLLQEFYNPDMKYRPQYFWFLNHDLNIEEMKRQLDQMKQAGAGGAFLHARTGRITPYMGEKWLKLCTEAIKYASEIGLLLWLYDEDGFPSGFASGETLVPNNKDYAANFIVITEEFEAEPGETITEKIIFENPTSELFGIVALPVEETEFGYNLINYPNECIDITENYENDQFTWTAPDTHELWLVCPFIREWNPRAADVLNQKAMAHFISISHERYYQYFKQEKIDHLMGTTIPGIFTDEPAVQYCIGDKSWRRILVYSKDLRKKYQEKYDLSLLYGLPAMFYDVKEKNDSDTKSENNSEQKINPDYRLNYWLLASEMYSTAYFKQIYDWCEEHNIWSTGHMANDSPLFNQVRDQIDWFANAKYMHLGPSDQLGTDYRGKFQKSYGLGQIDNMMTPRFAGSSGRIFGCPRNISECFGSSGWEISLEQQKILIDWQVANGINLFIPHDFSYSIEGRRKRDHPPAFERCSYWDEIKVLNDYIGRISFAFSQEDSGILPRIGVLYGNRTVLADMNPMKGNYSSLAHDAQAYITDILQRLQYDFDFLPEEFLWNSKIITTTQTDENQINTGKTLFSDGKNSYDILILASLRTIDSQTLNKLYEFAGSGGSIIFIQQLPSLIYNKKPDDRNLSELYSKFGLSNTQIENSIKNKDLIENFPKLVILKQDMGLLAFIQTPKDPLWNNEIVPEISSIISRVKKNALKVSLIGRNKGDFVVRRLNLNDQYNSAFCFVVNLSDDIASNSNVEILNQAKNNRSIWSNPKLYELNLLNGNITQISSENFSIDAETGKITLINCFNPKESKLFFVTEIENQISGRELQSDNYNILTQSVDFDEAENIVENKTWDLTPIKGNILNLNDWKVKYTVEKMGIERPSYLKYNLRHEIRIKIDEIPEKLILILDGEITHLQRNIDGTIKDNQRRFTLSINGNDVKRLNPGKVLDFHMLETENISKYLIQGENIFEVITYGGLSSPMYSLTEPPRIYGDFVVINRTSSENIPVITKWNLPIKTQLEDLVGNGFPNYVSPIDYQTTFEIKDELSQGDKYILSLPDDYKPLYKIWINDKLVDHIWFGVYKTCLTNLVKGENKIRIRYYTYPTNLYESTKNPLGIIDPIKIFKN